jgi:hypothetical protein
MAARGSTIGGEACRLSAGRHAARYCTPRSRLDAHVCERRLRTTRGPRTFHAGCFSKDSESMRLAFMSTRIARFCAGGDPLGPGPVNDGLGATRASRLPR